MSAGQTAVALTACGACGPSSAYAYQSAQLTADAVLSEGNKLYSVSGADNLGTSASSSGANVQVDNTGPVLAAVIANTTTNEPGWLAQASGYRVYANVTELPSGSGTSSGVNASSITANVSNVTTGQTAVALTTSGCPCTIGGTTYAYRSAALTSNNPLSAGSKSFTASASDNLGTSTTQSGSVTIDNTAPTLSTLQMFDVDADGKVDQVKATFSETLETYSAPTTVWTLANAPGGASNTLASVAVATPVATLTLNEGNVNTASGTFTIALAANASGIRDLAGNQSSFAATSVADKAAPVPTNVVLANVQTAGRARSAGHRDRHVLRDARRDELLLDVVERQHADDQRQRRRGRADRRQCCGRRSVGRRRRRQLRRLDELQVRLRESRRELRECRHELLRATTPTRGRLVWSPTTNTLTITLGQGNGSQTGVAVSTPIYTPERRAQGSRGQRDDGDGLHRAGHIPILSRPRSTSPAIDEDTQALGYARARESRDPA